jgi:hypothetical protein
LPADLILVTHGYHDHNKIQLVTQKPDCRVISHKEVLAGDKRNSFDVGGIAIQAVEAKNLLHGPKRCGGPAMGLKTAAERALLIGAKHNIVVRLAPGALFDRAKAEK